MLFNIWIRCQHKNYVDYYIIIIIIILDGMFSMFVFINLNWATFLMEVIFFNSYICGHRFNIINIK